MNFLRIYLRYFDWFSVRETQFYQQYFFSCLIEVFKRMSSLFTLFVDDYKKL